MYSVLIWLETYSVLAQAIAQALRRAFLGEHLHLERGVELGQHVSALIRQAELLAGRQIPALVLLLADVVHRDEDAQHDEDAGAGQRAVAGPAARHGLGDFPPLARRVENPAGDACIDQVRRVLIEFREAQPLRQTEDDCGRGEDERRAEPPESAKDFRHYPRHRSLSTDLTVRNSPNEMKLR